MIDVEVEKLAKLFITRYSLPLDVNNPYKLDLTLYSTSLLDFILNFNFLSARINNLEEELLQASSYVGLTLHRLFFQANPQIDVDLTLSEIPSKEVKLTIKNLPITLKEASVIKLTSLLKKTYIERKIKPESLKGDSIHPSLLNRPIYPMLLGIALGHSSYYEGPIKDVPQEELSIHFHEIFYILCEEINDTLKVNNPILSQLNLIELCNPNLIGLPLGFQEQHLGSRVIHSLNKLLQDSTFSEEEKEQFFRSLLKMPDAHLSSLGYVFVASGKKQLKSMKELGEFSMNYPLLASSLRAMYQYLRKTKGKKGWEEYLTAGNISAAWEELDIEVSCGLLPFIYAFDYKDILNSKHFIFYDLLAYGKTKEALNIGNKINKKHYTPSFLVTYICHLLYSGKIEKGQNLIAQLNQFNSSNPVISDIANCLNYLAYSLSNQLEELKQHIFKAVDAPNLWNLNYIYLKTYLEDRIRTGSKVSPEIFPETTEEGQSLCSDYYSYLLVGKKIEAEKTKFSASSYHYWTDLLEFKKEGN